MPATVNGYIKSEEILFGLDVALRCQPGAATLCNWRDLLSGKLSFEGYYAQMSPQDELTCLTLDTTGECDLSCRECYYHPNILLNRTEAPLESVFAAIEDASLDLNLKTLVIAGKEPFFNPHRLFEILKHAGSYKNRSYRIGITTNGRHINSHWNRLEHAASQGWLDYLDVSIDSGFSGQHDAIRGVPGTYELAVTAVRDVAEKMPQLQPFICSRLRSDNSDGVLELLCRQSDLIRRFWICPIQPPPFSEMLPLGNNFIVAFLHKLISLMEDQLSGREIEVTVPLQGLHLSEAIESGLFNWQDLREDDAGTCYVPIVAGKNELIITCSILPEHAWKLARITYAGDYLAQMHFLQAPDPARHAVGNIATQSIKELYRKSKQPGGVLHHLCLARTSHECRQQSCWGHCFGGWSIAEQSLLDGTAVYRKPRFCVKHAN